MPGKVRRLLAKYKHKKSINQQCSPYPAHSRKYEKVTQDPVPNNKTTRADEKKRKLVQLVTGSILYYTKGVDMTILAGLSTLATEQEKETGQTVTNIEQLLDYLATNLDATI